MQSIHFPIKKNRWLLLPLAITVFALFSISSCKEKKVNSAEALTKTDFPCVELTYTTVRAAWTDAQLGSINYFTFFTDYDRPTKTFKVYAEAYDVSHNLIGSIVDLGEVPGCSKRLGFVAVGRNNIDKNKLGIISGSGSLVKFVNIKLTPDIHRHRRTNFLNYHLEVITEEETTPVDDAYPCPPCINCKPQCPAPFDTIPIDAPEIDTTGG